MRFHGTAVHVHDNRVVIDRGQGEVGEDGRIGDVDDVAEVCCRILLGAGGRGVDVDESDVDMHDAQQTVETPLNMLADADLVPGSAALARLNADLR